MVRITSHASTSADEGQAITVPGAPSCPGRVPRPAGRRATASSRQGSEHAFWLGRRQLREDLLPQASTA
jgi:hypothetical protein